MTTPIPLHPLRVRDATTEELLAELPLTDTARDAILNLPVGTVARTVGTGRWELVVGEFGERRKLVVSSTTPGAYSNHAVSVRAYREVERRAHRAGHSWTYLTWQATKLADWGEA